MSDPIESEQDKWIRRYFVWLLPAAILVPLLVTVVFLVLAGRA